MSAQSGRAVMKLRRCVFNALSQIRQKTNTMTDTTWMTKNSAVGLVHPAQHRAHQRDRHQEGAAAAR